MQEVEFFFRQGDDRAHQLKLASTYFQGPLARLGHGVLRTDAAVERLDVGGQFGKLDRLGEIVVGAQAQAQDAAVEGHAARQHQHADLRIQLAHAGDDIETIFIGQAQVQHHHAYIAMAERSPHAASRAGDMDFVLELNEELRHVFGVVQIVFDDQYFRHCYAILPLMSCRGQTVPVTSAP